MLLYAFIAYLFLQIYTAGLIVLRSRLFATKLYRPMLWNLFLSLVPLLLQIGTILILVVLAGVISAQQDVPTWVITAFQCLGIFGLFAWALFFPNATYLITELNFSHRKADDKVPEYYDIVMVFTLAVTGVINGLVSLAFFHFVILIITNAAKGTIPLSSWIVVIVYVFASSFAIYLGREVRVNSWDILHPFAFLRRLWGHFHDRMARKRALGYTLFFSGILLIAHMIFFNVLYPAIF